MKVIDFLRRYFCLCHSPSYSSSKTTTTTTTTTTFKNRLSTSTMTGAQQRRRSLFNEYHEDEQDSLLHIDQNYPPPSKSTVVGTIFGHRRGRVCLCFEERERLSSTPHLLLELSTPTYVLAKEMRCGLLRITLECDATELSSCSLHSVPLWTMRCNGRKVGFAVRRKVTDRDRLILKMVKSTSAGAGVLPTALESSKGKGELMYMKANYERVVGGCDSESYHLINPCGSPGQALSVFLLRSG